MSTIYEIETEKIKIKYEKVIGLTPIHHILLDCCCKRLDEKIEIKDNDILYYYDLYENIKMLTKTDKLSHYNTSHIIQFYDIAVTMLQSPSYVESLRSQGKNIIEEIKFNFGKIIFDNGSETVVKESADEIKKLWNSV